MAKKKIKKVIETNKKESNLHAFIAAFFSIIGFIIALVTWKDDDYVIFYAKQSLVIFVIALFVPLITITIGWIPIIGIGISFLLNLAVFVLWLLCWINALSGRKRELILVSIFSRKIKL